MRVLLRDLLHGYSAVAAATDGDTVLFAVLAAALLGNFVLGLVVLIAIFQREVSDRAFSVWFGRNRVVFVLVMILASVNPECYHVLRSRALDLDALTAPQAPFVGVWITRLGLVTNVAKDVPALVVSTLLQQQQAGDVPFFVFVSTAIACLSLLNGLLKRSLLVLWHASSDRAFQRRHAVVDPPASQALAMTPTNNSSSPTLTNSSI